MELSELFIRGKSHVAEYRGGQVWSCWRAKLPGDREIGVTFVRSAKRPVPGLCIGVRGGTAVVNEVEGPEMVLWSDTSPRTVEVTIKAAGSCKEVELELWNCWRTEGLTDAWVGNAAMLVEAGEGSVTLRCNSGPSRPKFKDLVVEIHGLAESEAAEETQPSKG